MEIQAIRPYLEGFEAVGSRLKGRYTYSHQNGAPESGSAFRWLRAREKAGPYTEISGETGVDYTLSAEDAGCFIQFEVTPRSSAGQGAPRRSVPVGPVLTQEQSARIRDRFANGRPYLENVRSLQDEIARRLGDAAFFLVDSGALHGSDFFYARGERMEFDASSRPVVREGIVYVQAGFFRAVLQRDAPEIDGIDWNGRRYYPLREAAGALGLFIWSGEENQGEVAHFRMRHLGQGLVIVSRHPVALDPVADRDLIDEACNLLYSLRADEEQMQWFRDARYGLFIHFDPSSLLGVEISWARKALRPHDSDNGCRNPIDPVYDTQYLRYNPARFDADGWMQFAKEAGMRYVIFTAKHHGGFSNFYSDYDCYTIEHTPYGKDLVAQYTAAARRAGLRVGIYYSIRDWYHPYYLTQAHDRYLEYLFGQLSELLTRYGTIDLMWFDSIGESSMNRWDLRTLLRRMKQYNPALIVNNRFAAVRGVKKIPAELQGDFDTPEQKMGDFQSKRPWESCMTILQSPERGGGWSWRTDCRVRTVEESLQYLINNAVNDGNLAYNICPGPDGTLDEKQMAVFRKVGEWLTVYGASIYHTRGGPYIQPRWGGSTYRDEAGEIGAGRTLYLHIAPVLWNSAVAGQRVKRAHSKVRRFWNRLLLRICNGYTARSISIACPPDGRRYAHAVLLKNGKSVELAWKRNGYRLTLPEGGRWDVCDTVIRLTESGQKENGSSKMHHFISE